MRKKRVTGSQQIGEIGEGQLTLHFKAFGWQPRALKPDLGEDVIVDIYDEGASAGLAFYAQVKSSPKLSSYKLKNGDYSYAIETKDLNDHWRDYFPPVVLVLWDTKKLNGYWVAIEDVLKTLDKEAPEWAKLKRVKVCVPKSNTLDEIGLKQLRHRVVAIMLPVISKGKELQGTLRFRFGDDMEGQSQHEAILRHQATGEEVTLNSKYLREIKFSDWYERKMGKPEVPSGTEFKIGRRHSEKIEKTQDHSAFF